MTTDVFVLRKLGERPGQLLLRQVKRVVVDFLAGVVESFEDMCYFSQVSRTSQAKLAKGRLSGRKDRSVTDPLPNSMTMAPEGIVLAMALAERRSNWIS